MANVEVDYGEISFEHKKLVRRLVSPRSTAADWERFYTAIRARVTKQYSAWLYENTDIAGSVVSADDFMRGELTSFLLANKSERLRQFLNLKSDNSDHQHLFGTWFSKVVRSALDIAMRGDGGRTIPGDVEVKRPKGRDDGKAVTLFDTISSDDIFDFRRDKEGISLAKLLRHVGGSAFSKIIAKFWKKNPQETYIALMDAQLNFRYRKIAALLGREEKSIKNAQEKEEISIAGKLRNLRRKFFAKLSLPELELMFPSLKKYPDKKIREIFAVAIEQQGEEKFFGADGEADVDLAEQLGGAFETLYFRWTTGWHLELKLPFEVGDKALIRGVLSDGNDGVPQGTLCCCGKKRKVRANGHFEFPVSEFKKSSNSSELYFIAAGGRRSDGIPYVPEVFDEHTPTLDLLESWAVRKMSDFAPLEIAADLLDDFGYVLPQLLLKDEALASLPFKRFGVPLVDRKHLRREYNEAFVLFRAELAVAPESPLSPDGFVLPLEWRYYPYGAGLPSNFLPLHLSSLSRKVLSAVGKTEEATAWQLNPATRFFDDRVDFSTPGLLGTQEADVSSATGALAVSLKYAQNDVRYGGWPFASLKYDFSENKPLAIGGVRQKMSLAASFGGRSIFVSPDQQDIPHADGVMEVRKVSATSLDEIAEEIAFDHLRRLSPTWPVQFKTVNEEILAPRRKLSEDLFKLANKKERLETTGSFVVLFGGPGMGKSVLMWLLKRRCTATHKAFGYVCQAGRANQGWEFVKSLAHGLATTYGEATEELLSADLPDAPPKGDALRDAYRRLVVEPLYNVIERRKGEKLFVLVDGLDEDACGEVFELLLDAELKLPARVGVVVSSRRIVQDEDRLESRASDVMDLDGQDAECARDVRMDVRTYIDQWTCTNPVVYDKLFESEIDSEKLKDAILAKDKSFLYASYVLGGIAEGRYSIRNVEELEKDLPRDLKSCFYDSFKARFSNAKTYARVKPLLRLLACKGCVDTSEAGRNSIVGDENLGAILKALRGYAVESEGEISLSSEALRMWLNDSTHNAEFGV